MLNFTEAQINDKLLNMALQSDLNVGFKGYWWKKYSFSVNSTSYTNDSLETRVTQSATSNNNSDNTHIIYYTDDFEIVGATFKPKGTIQSISGTFSYIGSNISTLKNKYAWLTSSGEPQSTLVKMTDSTTYVYNEYDSTIKKYVGCANNAIKYSFTQSLYDYVCSADINAYPNGDFAEDGYYYELVGKLLEASTKIEFVEWVGTGNKGSSSAPISLNFGFAPKVVIYLGKYNTASPYYEYGVNLSTAISNYIIMDILTTTYKQQGMMAYTSSYINFMRKSSDGKTLEWYNTQGETYAFNESGYKYFAMAIG